MRTSQDKAEPGSGRPTGIITALLLLVCIVATAFYSYMKSVNPSAAIIDLPKLFQGSGNGSIKEAQVLYRFEYDSSSNPVFALYGGYIAECNSGGIWFLDKKGQIIWSEPIVLESPILKTGGSRLLAADAGKGEVLVIEGRSIVWKDKVDEPILNADINEDGYVTVITTSKRNNNEIRVYDPHGVGLIRKVVANDFAVSARISPSGKTLAVSGISTGNSAAFSGYKYYDMEGNETAGASFNGSGEFLPIFWFSGEKIFAAGDRTLALLDEKANIVWKKQFKSIAGTAPYGTGSIAAAVEEDKGYSLVLYPASGEKPASGALQGKPAGLAAVKGTIAVNTSDTVFFFNSRCKSFSKYSANTRIKQVCLFDSHQAVVITGNEVIVVNIN